MFGRQADETARLARALLVFSLAPRESISGGTVGLAAAIYMCTADVARARRRRKQPVEYTGHGLDLCILRQRESRSSGLGDRWTLHRQQDVWR